MIDFDGLLKLRSAAHGRFYLEGNVLHAMSGRVAYVYPHNPYSAENGAYIVAACNAVPELVAELKEARAENGELKRHSEWLERKLQIRIDNNAELIKRVRELEFQLGEIEFDNSGLCRENDALKRQRDWLAQKCEAFCLDSDLEDCPHCPFREETPCFLSDKESWIKFAEQAAKEAE